MASGAGHAARAHDLGVTVHDCRGTGTDLGWPTIAAPSRRHVQVQTAAVVVVAMLLATWRLRTGLALVGDSASYLAGAAGFEGGHPARTPLVPSFSEQSLIATVRAGGWSPFRDFGLGLPAVIGLVSVVVPLRTAAAVVSTVSVGAIAAAVMVGPWAVRRRGELWVRTILAIGLSCWPILRFTAAGVLSEPLFTALALWLAIVIASRPVTTRRWLVIAAVLAILIGLTRFVGPAVALAAAVLLAQRGVSARRAVLWGAATTAVPIAITAIAAGSARVLRVHPRGRDDVFFLARGVGGWFDAGRGDVSSTLLRTSFEPALVDWIIAGAAVIGAVALAVWWLRPPWRRPRSPLEPALVLALVLAAAVVPSMYLLDAVLKLENRIVMPSGALVLAAAGWWLGGRARAPVALGLVTLWVVVATQPWQWMERPPAAQPTSLTDAVAALDVPFVVTNEADRVWWHTGVPAAYLPTGYRNLSDRTYDPGPIMEALPCALWDVGGVVVVDTSTFVPELAGAALDTGTADGRYDREDLGDGVVAYRPTGLGCPGRVSRVSP